MLRKNPSSAAATDPVSSSGGSWVVLVALWALAAVLVWALQLPGTALDWQPALAARQPWRAWTAAFVHWSPLHLGANLLAAAVVAGYGWSARVPWRATAALAAAWPLTHLALSLQCDLVHYGGLSGVLHAGVAIVSLWLVVAAAGRRRAIGAAVFTGLVLKLLSEQPWGPALQLNAGWDIAVAPLAHATGALAGLLCAAVALMRAPAPAGSSCQR